MLLIRQLETHGHGSAGLLSYVFTRFSGMSESKVDVIHGMSVFAQAGLRELRAVLFTWSRAS